MDFLKKDAFLALHNDMPKVNKYLKMLEIGKIQPDDINIDILEESRVNLKEKDFFFLIIN